ncbi:NAD+ kinase [Alkalispirochaeta americana]|uniref:NAD kinase n=1 Tax=Alkalispirochaeta americana TaxID=159291 RepID=A0A1N6PJK8_9SPIO|nr:NAD(+)/NADH kinase [Alkalispirochaeta americana]SIQ04399.1 NAD+ kinase [Alkalispirochaeta americana]
MPVKDPIQSVLVIANTAKAGARELAGEIESYCIHRGLRALVVLYEGESSSLPEKDGFDLAITLGGDGTVLFASRVLAGHNVPILPVNLGDFGFISEVGHDEWQQALERYLAGGIDIGDRLVLDVEVVREGKPLCAFRGLNDAVVSSEGISRMIRLTVRLSDQYLGVYRADGVMVATPTGSTAYSAAAGGPILHPEMEAMILNPICPFTLSHRPIVIPPDEVVEISIAQEQRTEVALTVDGQTLTPLVQGDAVIVRASPKKARIVRSDRRTFYEVLRSKLNWAGGLDD